jgi:geranylgeranyl diphosphate synthase type I
MDVFNEEQYRRSFRPEVLQHAVYSYLNRPAKRMRPGVVFFSCGAVGGREESARLAAAAVEVYHTWTLVHDDIIDNDCKRRGCPTVHEEIRLKALDWGYHPKEAADLGRDIAILTGDLQHAWAVRLLLDSAKLGVPAPVIMDLIGRMENELTNGLVEGEALDVIFAAKPIEELTENEVLRMLELKTGVLYEFSGIAGAAIGIGQSAEAIGLVRAIGRFARQCGTAFQLQDDILGITGNEKLLGKAVDSDIREGKRTIIVLHAFSNAGTKDRRLISETLGNPLATPEQVQKVKQLLTEYNGIEYARNLADSIVERAIEEVEPLPGSRHKDLLLTWAKYVVNRDF